MNITLQLKKGNVDNNFQERGDIIKAYKTPPEGIGNPGEKFYFIHITGFPTVPVAKLKRWRDKITGRDYVGTGEFDEDGVEIQELRNSRAWSIPVGALTQQARNLLATKGEITVTWQQVKPYVRRKLKRIARDDSANNDTYVEADHESLTDEDVTNA